MKIFLLSESEITFDETEKKLWLKYGITDEEFAQIKPWELYSPYITEKEYYELAPWKNTSMSEDEFTWNLYCNRSNSVMSYQELYDNILKEYLPDEQYEQILDEMLQCGSEIVKKYADFYATAVNTASSIKEYICDYVPFEDIETEKKYIKTIEQMPAVYKRFPNLSAERYSQIISLRKTSDLFSYQEALIAGTIKESDPKLTYNDIVRIIDENSTADSVTAWKQVSKEINKIQPYCDKSVMFSRNYYPTGNMEDEVIKIGLNFGKITICYFNKNMNDESTILAEYDIGSDNTSLWYESFK